jgi:putative glutamine amidotransferase
MAIRIAIPEPTGSDAAYNARSLPQYISALEAAGAKPVIVPLNELQERVARMLVDVQGVLLPGSGFDVDPERYGEARIAECGEADPARTAVDELLLQDAFNLRKPILAICHGAKTLNVWGNG